MSVTLSVISTRREHLFRIAELLTLGLKSMIPDDPHASLTIAVNGEFDGGKKIFPDAARNYLFKTDIGKIEATGPEICRAPLPAHIAFKGMPEFNEHWIGAVDGKMMELSFLNADWVSGSYDRCDDSINFLSKAERAKAFPRCRTYPGLTFVHNSRSFAQSSDIAIWLEGAETNAHRQEYGSHLSDKHEKLRTAFHKALHSNAEWVRYVEITINNEDLLNNSVFLKALNTICEGQLDKALWSFEQKTNAAGLSVQNGEAAFAVPVLTPQSYKLSV